MCIKIIALASDSSEKKGLGTVEIVILHIEMTK